MAFQDDCTRIAKEVGCSLTQLLVAWCGANTNVPTVILGATSVTHLDENIKALEFVDKITPEIKEKIDAIVQFRPVAEIPMEPFLAHIREQWIYVGPRI